MVYLVVKLLHAKGKQLWFCREGDIHTTLYLGKPTSGSLPVLSIYLFCYKLTTGLFDSAKAITFFHEHTRDVQEICGKVPKNVGHCR